METGSTKLTNGSLSMTVSRTPLPSAFTDPYIPAPGDKLATYQSVVQCIYYSPESSAPAVQEVALSQPTP